MKKVRQLISRAWAFAMVILAAMLTACEKESTIYLTVKSDDGKMPVWGIIAIIAGVILIIAIFAIISSMNKKRRATEEAEAEANAVVLTQDPNAVSEYIFDDEKVSAEEEKNEEAPAAEDAPKEDAAEEKSEEAPAAEDAPEEDAAEDKSEEAPVTEEAEEKSEEAAPVEEIVEEVADANFASYDKADVTEEKAEETEEKVEAAEDKAEVTVEEEKNGEPEYTLDANGLPVAPDGMVIRYKWSFLARLIQSDDELKYRYMMLRRKLLSYKKVRSNVSWNFDSYFIGRTPIVKLKVRGKTLVAYFPIDPKEMEGTKYVGEDFSGVSRYKAVPFAYRINGMRKLKYALELIEKQLEGIKASEPVYITESQVNEVIPRESLKKLYEKGYVRVGGILAVGDRASAQDEDDDDVVDVMDVADDNAEPSPLKEEFNFNPKAQ